VLRSKQEARANYDRLSRWYDALAGSERHFAEIGLDQLAPVTGQSILEIGYGTGYALVRLARAVGPTGTVYGIDISEGMRAVTERRVRRAGLSSRVHLTAGDASVLPFKSGSLDGIFMSFTLELFDVPEIPLVLNECRRVMTPEGRMCLVSMAAEQHPYLATRLYEWFHEHFPTVVDCRPIKCRQSLEAAGFRVQRVSCHRTWGLPLEISIAEKESTSS
jgi:ubiquinone/menaquinone biosynthesis C-methylase UbiE